MGLGGLGNGLGNMNQLGVLGAQNLQQLNTNNQFQQLMANANALAAHNQLLGL
jgi:hypothetical protein